MYSDVERTLMSKLSSSLPPLYREQREQFVTTLPWLALISLAFVVLLGGWISSVLALVRLLIASPMSILGLLFTGFFWLVLLPPILWAVAFVPLRERRLAGWRLFTGGTVLFFISSLVRLSLFNLVFTGAILYFTLLCYEEFHG